MSVAGNFLTSCRTSSLLKKDSAPWRKYVHVCSLTYPACKAHSPYYTVICVLLKFTIFFHIITQTGRFSGKKKLTRTKGVF